MNSCVSPTTSPITRSLRRPRSSPGSTAWKRACSARSDAEPEGVRLRDVLRERALSPVHAQHVLRAFRQDVTKLRYDDWDDLIEYCRYSAMPVGRYVLDVHGESQSTWPANDALCAALQIINHLQDCAKDYRELDRVYIPLDALAANGLTVEALAAPRATPALMRCIGDLAARTGTLLEQSRPFALQIRDRRLAMEVAAIQSLAERLVGVLRTRDPLSERVHLSQAADAVHRAFRRHRRGCRAACSRAPRPRPSPDERHDRRTG